jgi:hypothetical protein
MRKRNILYIFMGTGMLSLLWVMILSATGAKVVKTYTNPVLVETFIIQREKPDNFSGVLGIGDPYYSMLENTTCIRPVTTTVTMSIYPATWSTGIRGPGYFRLPSRVSGRPMFFIMRGTESFTFTTR